MPIIKPIKTITDPLVTVYKDEFNKFDSSLFLIISFLQYELI